MRETTQRHEDEQRLVRSKRASEIGQRAGSLLAAPRPHRALDATGVLALQRSVGNAATTDFLQRETEEEHDGHRHGGGDKSPVHDAISKSGSPLDPSVRKVMEPVLGTSLSSVQTIPDRTSTAAVKASAFTVKDKIVYNPDQVKPGTEQADHTFFHETAHVKQQHDGPVSGTPQKGGIKVSDPSDRFEQEAERTAQQAMGLQRMAHHPGDGHDHAGEDDLD